MRFKIIYKTINILIMMFFLLFIFCTYKIVISKTFKDFQNETFIFESGVEDKVSVFLCGRLGNQMFNYAAAYALAKTQNKNGVAIIHGCKDYSLDIFNIPQIFVDPPKESNIVERVFTKRNKFGRGTLRCKSFLLH